MMDWRPVGPSAARIRVRPWCGVAVILAVTLSAGVAAQAPPPPHSTVTLPGAVRSFYRALEHVIVAAIDGVKSAYHFVVPGQGGIDALEGLREGSTVVVRHTPGASEPGTLAITEGTVTHIDRSRQRITVRFEQGRLETFRVTERAGRDVPAPAAANGAGEPVTISYTDANGQRIAQTFTRE